MAEQRARNQGMAHFDTCTVQNRHPYTSKHTLGYLHSETYAHTALIRTFTPIAAISSLMRIFSSPHWIASASGNLVTETTGN